MSKEEILKALQIIREPITVSVNEYKYFNQENYDKLVAVYNNCILLADEIKTITEENEELKRQLKDIQETYCKSSQLNHRKAIEIFKMKHQQKEFIKYLENLLITKRQKANTVKAYERTVIPIQGILIKFKEIIGVENEK